MMTGIDGTRVRALFAGRIVLAVVFAAVAAVATGAEKKKDAEATLTLANRDIAVFRAPLLGNSPVVRVERARVRFDQVDHATLAEPVQGVATALGEVKGISLLVGDRLIFSLIEADLDPEERLTLAQAAEVARVQLESAVRARRDMQQTPLLLRGLAHAAAATALLVGVLWLLGRVGRLLIGWLERRADALAVGAHRVRWEEYLARLLVRLLQLARWLLVVALLYGWLTYVLDHFPLTQPLGDSLGGFVTSLVVWLADGAIESLPGIITVVVILFVTRALVEVILQFFQSVQSGRTQVPFVHPETASATRRLVTMIAWTLGIIVAYPFIPGSGSDAFKGLSVLFGVVISLGSTSLVTQMMSGLVIIYSRALRKGDFVAVDGVEGVVMEIGTLATKIVTMRSEEVTIPNAVLIGHSIHNYSKLAGTQGALLSTKVTIGYDAPWRQVHALLVLAASRTPGLRPEPPAYVYQRALSDFYVEYELFAHIDKPLERVATLSALHANIQDTFNEHGVQIMSPHFLAQPANAIVVPQEGWYAAPARKPDSPKA
jgi:small-conductance mechanosensitive channel